VTPARKTAAAAAFVLLAAGGLARVQLASDPGGDETCADPAALIDADGLGLETVAVDYPRKHRHLRMDGYLKPRSAREGPLAFTVRRTFQLPNWLIRPTTALPGPKEPDRFETRTLDVDGTPVTVRFSYAMHRNSQRFAAYTLGFGGESRLSGFWLRVLDAPSSLLRGIRPITYIGVAGQTNRISLPAQEERALEFIAAAWRLYERACGT
jgi:hypothetical protein